MDRDGTRDAPDAAPGVPLDRALAPPRWGKVAWVVIGLIVALLISVVVAQLMNPAPHATTTLDRAAGSAVRGLAPAPLDPMLTTINC